MAGPEEDPGPGRNDGFAPIANGTEAMNDWMGHNIRDVTITIEARLFNSLTRFAGPDGFITTVSLPAGSTIGDLLRRLSVPVGEVYLVLRNGRDVTRSLHTGLNTEAVIDDGDVIAFSGPVPYSWGYGAPVV